MHRAVDILEDAADTADPLEVYQATHKAVASAMKVIGRADDSNGVRRKRMLQEFGRCKLP